MQPQPLRSTGEVTGTNTLIHLSQPQIVQSNNRTSSSVVDYSYVCHYFTEWYIGNAFE